MEKTLPFEREKHLYRRDDFEEICKDAMRFFSGIGISCLGDTIPTSMAIGVYAIYPIVTSGQYGVYGLMANRFEFHTPVYVGFSSGGESSWEHVSPFIDLPLSKQLVFWRKIIAKTSGMDASDFHFRAMESASFAEAFCVRQGLVEKYKPVWNKCFGIAASKSEISLVWKMIHSKNHQKSYVAARLSKSFEKSLKAVS